PLSNTINRAGSYAGHVLDAIDHVRAVTDHGSWRRQRSERPDAHFFTLRFELVILDFSDRGATMKRKRACVIAVLEFVLLIGLPVLAQAPAGQQAPPPMTNLQVWPKDTTRAVVLQFMNAFNESLGVQCNYCHVERDGRLDFASDDKREKRVARQMILLRDSINVVLPAIVGKPAGAGPTAGEGHPGMPIRVLCSMCHHGLPIPKAIADVVTEAANGSAAAGLAKFRELRTQYYGGQQYDFSEGSLVTIAQRAMTAK